MEECLANNRKVLGSYGKLTTGKMMEAVTLDIEQIGMVSITDTAFPCRCPGRLQLQLEYISISADIRHQVLSPIKCQFDMSAIVSVPMHGFAATSHWTSTWITHLMNNILIRFCKPEPQPDQISFCFLQTCRLDKSSHLSQSFLKDWPAMDSLQARSRLARPVTTACLILSEIETKWWFISEMHDSTLHDWYTDYLVLVLSIAIKIECSMIYCILNLLLTH